MKKILLLLLLVGSVLATPAEDYNLKMEELRNMRLHTQKIIPIVQSYSKLIITRVPGGWFYSYIIDSSSYKAGDAMSGCFVPEI